MKRYWREGQFSSWWVAESSYTVCEPVMSIVYKCFKFVRAVFTENTGNVKNIVHKLVGHLKKASKGKR